MNVGICSRSGMALIDVLVKIIHDLNGKTKM